MCIKSFKLNGFNHIAIHETNRYHRHNLFCLCSQRCESWLLNARTIRTFGLVSGLQKLCKNKYFLQYQTSTCVDGVELCEYRGMY